MVDGASGNTIRGNSIHDNSGLYGLGIDLGLQRRHAERLRETRTRARTATRTFRLIGSLNYGVEHDDPGHAQHTAVDDLRPRLLRQPICLQHPHDFLEGETYIGSQQVTTDGSGTATFRRHLAVAIELASPISATATVPDGNTSEFSQRIALLRDPRLGPAGRRRHRRTVAGMTFEAGATVTFGATAASNVVVTSVTAITVRRRPSRRIALRRVGPERSTAPTAALMKGWVADFLDVPGGQPVLFLRHHPRDQRDHRRRGPGPLRCRSADAAPADGRLPAEGQARRLLHAPPCTPGVFADVACPSTFASWIEQLAAEGITGGCGGDDYCPEQPRPPRPDGRLPPEDRARLRLPAAARLPRASSPTSPVPDVRQLDRAARRREHHRRLRQAATTVPEQPNTRGQMAVFIVKTFGLQ